MPTPTHNTMRNGARVKKRKGKNAQAQARHTAKLNRLLNSSKTWQRSQAATIKPNLVFASNPKPQASKTPVPYGVNNAIGIAKFTYAMPVWAIGTGKYTTQQLTINAIVITINNSTNIAQCYVKATKTNPAFFIQAYMHPVGFKAGLTQYTFAKWVKLFG